MLKATTKAVNTNDGNTHAQPRDPHDGEEVTAVQEWKGCFESGTKVSGYRWGPSLQHTQGETPARGTGGMEATSGVDISSKCVGVGAWESGTAEVKEVTHNSRALADSESAENADTWPLRVATSKEGNLLFQGHHGGETNHQFEEISVAALAKTDRKTEKYVWNEIHDAAIAVADFSGERQRQTVMETAKAARINVLDIIVKPAAAAYAHGWTQRNDEERNVVVYDLEEDSLNITILTPDKNTIKVKATARHDGGG